MCNDYDLVTFGEAMIRLASPNYMRLEACTQLDVSAGGAEWNVAVNCASLGLRTAWVSRLVDVWSGRLITQQAAARGVDVSNVVWSRFDGIGKVRNGFYHLETGVGPRASAVFYDRAFSAVSQMTPDMLNWKTLLSRSRWLHVSGITPALSPTLATTTAEVFRIARECGVTTSYDLNFRGKLWSAAQAQETNAKVVPHVSVLIGNEEDFEKCLGFKAEGANENYSALDPESYKQVVRRVVAKYPNVQMVGTTLRNAKTGLLNDWRTLLYDVKADTFHLSRIYDNLEIVDRVGGGDSFSAGLVYSLLSGKPAAEANEFAAAYSALAHTFPGDANWATKEEAEKASKGGGARIAR